MNDYILLDFDGTITTKDTTRLFFIELLTLRPWRIFGVVWIFYKMVRSKEKSIKQMYKNRAIGYLISGLCELDMTRVLGRLSKKVRALYRPLMLQKIEECNDCGIAVLVVTASPSFAIRHCVSDLPVTVIGTEFIKNDDIYSSKLSGKNCYGGEKVNKIKNYIQEFGLQYNVTEAWSDDFSDYPMLEMASRRYWIGDEKLQKIVREKDPTSKFLLRKD